MTSPLRTAAASASASSTRWSCRRRARPGPASRPGESRRARGARVTEPVISRVVAALEAAAHHAGRRAVAERLGAPEAEHGAVALEAEVDRRAEHRGRRDEGGRGQRRARRRDRSSRAAGPRARRPRTRPATASSRTSGAGASVVPTSLIVPRIRFWSSRSSRRVTASGPRPGAVLRRGEAQRHRIDAERLRGREQGGGAVAGLRAAELHAQLGPLPACGQLLLELLPPTDETHAPKRTLPSPWPRSRRDGR